MNSFVKVRTRVTPLDKANVDTDQIVPKQFLKLVQKSGFGRYLFYDWRYDENETPRPGFVLNDPQYQNSKILVAGDNFGCGSSREHAVWALYDYGFSVVMAPCFADIFYSNCFKNGVLPIRLNSQTISEIMAETEEIEIDLECQMIRIRNKEIPFEIDSYKKKILLEGLDDIEQTLQFKDEIAEFEQRLQTPSVL